MWAAWATNYVDQGAALGLGALGVVGGARWAVGKWEKARCRWWEDWDRVGEGLERDIKVQTRLLSKQGFTNKRFTRLLLTTRSRAKLESCLWPRAMGSRP